MSISLDIALQKSTYLLSLTVSRQIFNVRCKHRLGRERVAWSDRKKEKRRKNRGEKLSKRRNYLLNERRSASPPAPINTRAKAWIETWGYIRLKDFATGLISCLWFDSTSEAILIRIPDRVPQLAEKGCIFQTDQLLRSFRKSFDTYRDLYFRSCT